jgi:hypothetical protein
MTMDEKVGAMKRTLEELERELAGFEIDTAWRQRDEKRRAAIGTLCEAFEKQLADLVGGQLATIERAPARE